MRTRLVLPLLGLCLLASCRRSEPTKSEPPPAREHYLPLGSASATVFGKQYTFQAYSYQKGDREVVVGFAEWPGHPAGPTFVVLFRLPNGELLQPTMGKSGSGLPGSRISWDYRFAPAGGSCEVLYEIKDDPGAEHWSLNGKAYAADAGRVALADLTKNPPQVTQLNVDLKNLFPSTEPNQDQMRAALDKLRERHAEIQKFLVPGR